MDRTNEAFSIIKLLSGTEEIVAHDDDASTRELSPLMYLCIKTAKAVEQNKKTVERMSKL